MPKDPKGMIIIMSPDYGNDFITITDEHGEEFNLEHLATTEVDEQMYMAFLPADIDEDHEDYGIVILKVVEDNDDFLLEAIDDEAQLESIYEVFINILANEEDFDESD